MSSFGEQSRQRQAHFRDTSPTVSQDGRQPYDDKGKRNRHLLALGHEIENLHPSLRSEQGAVKFFADRHIHWWRSSRSGDETNANTPTRNMASSQIACVNFLLPLANMPGALLALAQGMDGDVQQVIPIRYTPRSNQLETESPVEFEWIGLDSPLEEDGPYTRGANVTSADALMIAQISTGKRRAYIFEWKYVERYEAGHYLGKGQAGDTRCRRYSKWYNDGTSSFKRNVPLNELLYEPFYQLIRLGLLGDKMIREKEFGISEAKVVVVCPQENADYQDTITSPPLQKRFPQANTVEMVAKSLWRDPGQFIMTSPEALTEKIRQVNLVQASEWLTYQHERYGW